MTTGDIDRTAVALALGQPLADEVLDGRAKIEPVPVPGVESTVVWRVHGESGEHPWQLYVGVWPDGEIRVLTGDQDAWADLITAASAHLADEDEARAYVETYLEVTRGAMVIVQPVTSLGDLLWHPGSPEQNEARAALLAAPPEMVPVVSSTDDGFQVELTLVVDQRLQRNEFEVTSGGEITSASFRVLADGLPLPIAR